MINVFFPYYLCGDVARQKEIDLCLQENVKNPLIDHLYVLIDDGSACPIEGEKLHVIYLDSRPTYKKWIELTDTHCKSGHSILCNSDIYFDTSISEINNMAIGSNSFMALSRWELLDGSTSKHPNPHWSQDTWAIPVGQKFSDSFIKQLDFPMGVPRCDNKISYLFAVQGWKVFNPVDTLKSIHVHETQMRTYHKKLDDRILGTVAYVHPSNGFEDESNLDFDVWTKRTPNINKVAINKAMERWIEESKSDAQKDINITQNIEFTPATSSELLDACINGQNLFDVGSSFQVVELNDKVYFKNNYQLSSIKSLSNSLFKASKAEAVVSAFIPPVMSLYVNQINDSPLSSEDLNFWQYPCATEKQAYENHLDLKIGENVDSIAKEVNTYIPIPWATYIDKKAFPDNFLNRIRSILRYYQEIAKKNGYKLKVHSVCQHIHWIRILEKAKELEITDLHLSHKDSKSESLQQEKQTNLTLHGWPLIAVNYETPDRSEGMERKPILERKLLASFIGAHMKHYRDDSRIKLFEAAKESNRDDVFVDLGSEWHFNKVVYEEQVLNKEIEAHHIDEHHQRTFRYNTILSDSKFSLCPEGAGPNTLRFWESIAVGSIPVIFSKDLAAFNESEVGKQIIENCIVWEKEIDDSLFGYLSSLTQQAMSKKQTNLIGLYEQIKQAKTFSKKKIHKESPLIEEDKKSKNIKILYVGASVTAQKNGYRPALNAIFEAQGFEVVERVIATGATGSLFGLCNLQTVKDSSYDLSIFEYSTGDLNIGLTPIELMPQVVENSLQILSNISAKVITVNNYRSDFESGKGDFIRNVYKDISKRKGIPCLNLFEYFENLKKQTNESWKEYYRDNVHTNQKGARIISEKIYKCFCDYSFSENGVVSDNKLNFFNPRMHFFSEFLKVNGVYTYPASRQEFPYITLETGKVLSFDLKGDLLGVIPIVGPKSGFIRIQANGKKLIEYSLFDQHCYYTRVQPRFIDYKTEKFVHFEIMLLEKEVDLSIAKESHEQHAHERDISISGIMGNNLLLKNVAIKEL